MPPRSVFVPTPSFENDTLRITGDEHRHLQVARVAVHESIEIFDGKGGIWTASVAGADRRQTIARISGHRQAVRDRHELILGLALIRMASFELALEKAVEIGIARIIPVAAERSNVTAEKRHDRWMRIIVEAAKQSKRYWLPALDEPGAFSSVLSVQAETKIVFAERGGGALAPAVRGSPVVYLVGPEGGWTDSELEAARKHGFALVGLGAGILKSETAAIVGGALIRYELERRERVE